MGVVKGDRISESANLNRCSLKAQDFFALLLARADAGGNLPWAPGALSVALYGTARHRGHVRAAVRELAQHGLVDPPRPIPDFRQWVSGLDRTCVSPQTRARIMKRDGALCRRCPSTVDLQIDHIVAVALGGSDDDSNLQVLCGRCNRLKGVGA